MSDSLFKPTSFEDVVESFGELLALRDEDSIRIAIAAYIANTLPTDAVWLFLIAASSSGKSEFIRALTALQGSHELSSLTPQTFLSGFNGKTDPSLLSNIKGGTVFLLKDFTTILSLRHDDRGIIMSQLREIYDGKIDKNFGNGVVRSWKGKVGFIAGSTYALEQEIMMNATYGDRFLYWKMPDVDTDAAMDKQMSTLGRETALRDAMCSTVAAYVATIGDPKIVKLPEDVMKGLRSVCKFAVMGRAPVTWDYSFSNIMSVGKPESPMRMFKQVLALATGLAALRGGEWDYQDWRLLTKIALDAIPSWRMNVVRFMLKDPDAWKTTTEVGVAMRLGSKTVRRFLEELEHHGILDRYAGAKGSAHYYRLTDKAVDCLAYEETSLPDKRERLNILPVATEEEEEYEP